MQREEILAAMQRTAGENGGKPLGMARFERATGIRQGDWLPYWSRFGDLQRDAGFERNQLRGAYEDAYLLEKLVALTREQGRLPTSRELVTKAHNDPEFPSHTVFQRRWTKSELVGNLLAYCRDKPEYADIVMLVEPLAEARAPTAEDASSTKDQSYGFVYLVKGHPGEFKIGRTNLVDRRLSELGVTASVKHELAHEIKTDDPSGVEAYWHRRFQAQRMRGEWFKLSAADVRAFKRWRRIY
jgi:hypothetical protein